MSSKIDLLKLKLSTYLIEIENYQAYKIESKIKKEVTNLYLTNLTNLNYQIIEIVEQSQWKIENLTKSNDYLTEITESLKIQNHTKVNTLTIILCDQQLKREISFNRENIIFINSENMINNLKAIFPQITMLKEDIEKPITKKKKNSGEHENFESSNDDVESDPKIQKKIQDFSTLLQTNNNVFVTWTLILLIIIPTLLLFSLSSLSEYSVRSEILLKLILGASDNKLIFIAHQYWRWFTYPFYSNEFYITFFACVFVWYYGKLSELIFKPWRLVLTILISVFIVGFVHSTTILNYPISGPIYIVCIILGSLFAYAFSNRSLTAFITRQKLFLPMMILLLFILMRLQYWQELIIYLLAFITGFFVSYALGYNDKKIVWDWTRLLAIVVPIILIGLGLVFYLFNKNLPVDFNGHFEATLEMYRKESLISEEFYQRIMQEVLR